jgi:hypothetical protein
MKVKILLIGTMATLAAFAATAQTSGGTSAGSAAGSSTPGMKTTTGNAGAAGTVVDPTGTQNSAGQRGVNQTTPGAPGVVGGSTVAPAPNIGSPAGTVNSTTPVNPGMQVGPGWQTATPSPLGTNQPGPGTGMGMITNQLGLGSNTLGMGNNVLGMGSNQFGVLSNRFGAMTNRFGGTNLLPTGRTNAFPRVLHGNEPGSPVGGGVTPPLPGNNP